MLGGRQQGEGRNKLELWTLNTKKKRDEETREKKEEPLHMNLGTMLETGLPVVRWKAKALGF